MNQYLNYPKSSHNNYSVQYQLSLIFRRIELVLFIFLSLFFLFLAKNNKNAADNISEIFIEIAYPITKVVSFPFNAFINLTTNFQELVDAKQENLELRKENEKLKYYQIKAINIYQENQELKNALNFVATKSSTYKVAKVISVANKTFNNSVFIDSGENRHLKQGSLVLGKNSVIGRVRDVFSDKSRVILVSDVDSRIPIITSKSRVRGILAGTNDNTMKILYLPKDHGIEEEELVFTASDGNVITPGLLVGIVKKVNGENVIVKMAEDVMANNVVTILEY